MPVERVRDAVEVVRAKLLPAGMEGVAAYLLYRFADAATRQIAATLSTARTALEDHLIAVRKLRAEQMGFDELMRRVEWSLRWSLLAAPWRA